MDLIRLRALWERLTQDTAFRVGTVYAGASWFVVEATDTLGGSTELLRGMALVLAVGFLVVVPTVWIVTRRASRPDPEEMDAHWGLPPAAPLRRRSRRGTRAWLAAVSLLAFLALGAWWAGRVEADEFVPAAATRMAVLPFHATGSDAVRELGVGMVDLLSAAMGGVAGIRTVSGRTVLARVGEAGATLDLDRSLSVGAAVGAGSILTGSITAVSGAVRLHGEVVSVADGSVLASADAEGSDADVLAVADELAVRLLREMWRSREPVPSVNTAALTTRSPAALRAYLDGERHLRAMRTDSAADAFREALAEDSTFALAWLRLTEATGWNRPGRPPESRAQRLEYIESAARFADRLPLREREMVTARALYLRGDFASLDSLAAYVRKYPDDPNGWYMLGDARFHGGRLGLHGIPDMVEPFRRAARLDPGFGLGLVHAIDLALDLGHRAEFDRLLEQYARVAPKDQIDGYRREAAIRWAPPDSVVHAFLDAARETTGAGTELNRLLDALGNRTRIDLDVDPMAYVEALDSARGLFPTDLDARAQALFLTARNLLALGRVEAGLERTEEALALRPGIPLPPEAARSFVRVTSAIEYEVPEELIVDDLARLEGHVDAGQWVSEVLHLYYLKAGRPDRADRFEWAPAPGEEDEGVDSLGLALAFDGYRALVRGDTARAVQDIDEGLRRLGLWNTRNANPTVFPFARAMAAQPETRDRGIRMLRWSTMYNASEPAQAYLSLARALEDAGEGEEARRAYAQVIRLWEGADANRQDEVEEARAALIRLTSEG